MKMHACVLSEVYFERLKHTPKKICDRKYAAIRWNEMTARDVACGHSGACVAFAIRRQSLRSNLPANPSAHVTVPNTA